jgi:uncharacterized protein YndB with AHSA1/START domain
MSIIPIDSCIVSERPGNETSSKRFATVRTPRAAKKLAGRVLLLAAALVCLGGCGSKTVAARNAAAPATSTATSSLQAPVSRTGMLIRRPPADVFRAFVDPAVTTKFWFTKSSGKLAKGARVRWEWEMHGVSTDVEVHESEENRRLVISWGTTVEFRFVPLEEGTYLEITERGFTGTPEEKVALAMDSVGGFSLVLANVKALLEHDVVLTTVADGKPKGLHL